MAYIADESVIDEVRICHERLRKLNSLSRADIAELLEATKAVLGSSPGDAIICPPFHADYGSHTHVGKKFFANYNCTILDVAKVTIGDNVMLAPNVAIYTAGHPIHPATRNSGYEYGKEVTIGSNVWIGGNAVICPGVHIGSNVVIGAGSVVTRNIPDWCVAAGNPCGVLRAITDRDRRKLFHDEEIDDNAWNDLIQRGFGN
ncbi:MAG: sugar O-acetyltransferase [Victivallales bacterium]|nr:sugar O-acetyltransferase [Victivallales bacterium]